jgi:FkbM family methyltransferase
LRGERNYGDFAIAKEFLKQVKSGTIIDIGANFGEWVLLMRNQCSLPIIAYEPSPYSCEVMRRIIDINGLSDVEVRNKACGDTAATIELEMSIVSYMRHDLCSDEKVDTSKVDHWADSMREKYLPVPVDVVRLDDDLRSAGPIGFIKIDTEGFEYKIIEGARQLIEEHKPHLYIEIHPGQIDVYGKTVKDFCNLMRTFDHIYDLSYIAHGKQVSEEEMHQLLAQQPTQPILLCTPKK